MKSKTAETWDISRVVVSVSLFLALFGCSTPPTTEPQSRDEHKTQVQEVARSGLLTITSVKIGQGDCTLIVFPSGKRLLIDCGSKGEFPGVEKVRGILLKQLPDPNIDLMIITHPDADHYNQASEVLGPISRPFIRIKKVMFVGMTSEYGSTKTWLESFAGSQRIVVNDGSYNTYPSKPVPGFEAERAVILAANVLTVNEPNTRSIVVKVSFGGFDALFTGDATTSTDRAILTAYASHLDALDVEFLKAAHHGAWATATQSNEWARRIKPETVVFSAALRNSYGHPDRRFVDLFVPYVRNALKHRLHFYERKGLESADAQIGPYETKDIYLTATNGSIVTKSDGSSWNVSFLQN